MNNNKKYFKIQLNILCFINCKNRPKYKHHKKKTRKIHPINTRVIMQVDDKI